MSPYLSTLFRKWRSKVFNVYIGTTNHSNIYILKVKDGQWETFIFALPGLYRFPKNVASGTLSAMRT